MGSEALQYMTDFEPKSKLLALFAATGLIRPKRLPDGGCSANTPLQYMALHIYIETGPQFAAPAIGLHS